MAFAAMALVFSSPLRHSGNTRILAPFAPSGNLVPTFLFNTPFSRYPLSGRKGCLSITTEDEMYTEALNAFIPMLIKRGLQYDPSGRLHHTHTKVDDTAPRPPMKFHLCTKEMRPEGRLTQADVDTIGFLMWQYAKEKKLEIGAIASVPRVGDEIAKAFLRAAEADGFSCPRLSFPKIEEGGISVIGPLTDDAGYPRGKPVWIFDDVVHRWKSKERMIERTHEADYIVAGVFVFLDYGQGAAQYFESIGVPFHAMLQLCHALRVGKHHGDITLEAFERMIGYLIQTQP